MKLRKNRKARAMYAKALESARHVVQLMEAVARQLANNECPVRPGDALQFNKRGIYYTVLRICVGPLGLYGDGKNMPQWYVVLQPLRARAQTTHLWMDSPRCTIGGPMPRSRRSCS